VSRLSKTKGGPVARFSAWYARRMFGQEPDPVGVTAHHPGLLRAYVGFEWELSRASRVDERLKNLAELKAAALTGCEYCLDIGSAIARKAGVTREQLTDLPRHRESPHFSERERLVLDYATAMSQTPVEVSDELFGALRAQFDEAQLVELTAVIAWENYRARFNWALDIEPQGFCRGACAVPELPAVDRAPELR
jgi:AhpD family alkylhydroperoxidase